jgi:Xaa-Pro dipeptidase
VTEPPSISEDSTLLMETGMVLTIEPLVQLPHGLYQTEEVCAVTDTGYDLLTPPAPRELWVVS